jgi:SAM-dependent methyltransferase
LEELERRGARAIARPHSPHRERPHPVRRRKLDVVISNQVFEHVFEPLGMLREINRVLRPEGALLAMFPTSDIWFEGHLGLYFVHWLHGWPRLQHAYCRL